MIGLNQKDLINDFTLHQKSLLKDLKMVVEEMYMINENLSSFIDEIESHEDVAVFFNPLFNSLISREIKYFFVNKKVVFKGSYNDYLNQIELLKKNNVLLKDGQIILTNSKIYKPKFLDNYVWLKDIPEEYINNIRNGIDLLKSDIELYNSLNLLLHFIVPLKSKKSDLYNSWSVNNEQGVIYMTVDSPPHIIAETIIHECDHQKLFLYEFVKGNITNNNADEVYISPWRDDLRPIEGLIKGASAFSTVSIGLIKILEKNNDYPKEQIFHRVVQCSIEVDFCLKDIKKHSHFSESGINFIKLLEKQHNYCMNYLNDSKFKNLKQYYTKQVTSHYNKVSNERN